MLVVGTNLTQQAEHIQSNNGIIYCNRLPPKDPPNGWSAVDKRKAGKTDDTEHYSQAQTPDAVCASYHTSYNVPTDPKQKISHSSYLF